MQTSDATNARKCTLPVVLCFSLLFFAATAQQTWKAGLARIDITPKQPLLMAGYATRTHPAEGKLSELWVKVLVLQDASGNRAAVVTSDLLGFPKSVSDRIRSQLESNEGLSKSQIILNSSHTHSGPVLGEALQDIYPFDSARQLAVNRYTEHLETQIVEAVVRASRNMEPVKLYAQQGIARFQVNRRNNAEASLDEQIELKGPNDYSVPVFKVADLKGKTKAILFGYACHATVLGGYEWSGDYPGYAQCELETAFPGVTALFFQGAAGDQNPLPRKKLSLARKYGAELATAVKAVLEDPMEELAPQLQTAYHEVDLALDPLPQAELEKVAQSSEGYMKRWANRMLNQPASARPASWPYPVQVWKLGKQGLVTLGGEVTIGYAIRIKKMLGKQTFVMAYSNDVMGYIPTTTILNEGGYEGLSSQMVYGLPGKWRDSIEETILDTVAKTAASAGLEER